MKSYCVDFGNGKYFNVDADRFEICESGYCYFWIKEHIFCSVEWDIIYRIQQFIKVDSRYTSLKTIWTYENGFAVET